MASPSVDTSQRKMETSSGNYPGVCLTHLWTYLHPHLSCLSSFSPVTADELSLLLSETNMSMILPSLLFLRISLKWLFLLFSKSLPSPCLLDLSNQYSGILYPIKNKKTHIKTYPKFFRMYLHPSSAPHPSHTSLKGYCHKLAPFWPVFSSTLSGICPKNTSELSQGISESHLKAFVLILGL